jgi:hypothetical protein
MNGIFHTILPPLGAFFGKRKNRRLIYLVLLGLFALAEFRYFGLTRRTFVFYSGMDGKTVVEDRMLRRSPSRETDIRRYVDEALLGPVSPDSALLFPRETRLGAFMLREAVVYADLSESAALPLPDGKDAGNDVFRSLLTLNEGIRRNFPYVRDVRLFIGGNEVFFNEFRGIFENSADNNKTSL